MTDKFLIGALEKVDLKQLGLSELTARIDTGAQTSSLHAVNIQESKKNGQAWVEFDCVLDDHSEVHVSSPIAGVSLVKSSNGKERRIVIETELQLATHHWPVKLTLSDRSSMAYPMLLGREAMAGRVIVDPSVNYLV